MSSFPISPPCLSQAHSPLYHFKLCCFSLLNASRLEAFPHQCSDGGSHTPHYCPVCLPSFVLTLVSHSYSFWCASQKVSVWQGQGVYVSTLCGCLTSLPACHRHTAGSYSHVLLRITWDAFGRLQISHLTFFFFFFQKMLVFQDWEFFSLQNITLKE